MILKLSCLNKNKNKSIIKKNIINIINEFHTNTLISKVLKGMTLTYNNTSNYHTNNYGKINIMKLLFVN